MLVDLAEISVEGGHGGAGKVSFGKLRGSGPDGGNGGKGGDVYIKSQSDLTLLNRYISEKYFKAQNGFPGLSNNRTGKSAEDTILLVPTGTEIVEKESNKLLHKFSKDNDLFLIAKGGIGGRGNSEFKSSRNTTPMKAQPGMEGESLDITLNLKLIADYGFVGLPNAGKSSLLNELTNANAKTGNFSFTTLSPNLGVLNGKILADIPGLIEGASEGKGLGIKFLKHIEKVKVLLHCISSDSEDIERDYKTVRDELEKYNKKLLKKKEVIILTKSDIRDASFKDAIKVSIHDWDSIQNLIEVLK